MSLDSGEALLKLGTYLHRLLHSERSFTPPPLPNSHYADPNTIEHQTTATGGGYAMMDVKGKKKKQTQQAALYQVRTV